MATDDPSGRILPGNPQRSPLPSGAEVDLMIEQKADAWAAISPVVRRCAGTAWMIVLTLDDIRAVTALTILRRLREDQRHGPEEL